MRLQRFSKPAATLLPGLFITAGVVSPATACFVQPATFQNDSTGSHADTNGLLQSIVEQKFSEFPLFDVNGRNDSVGRLVYGVAREDSGTLNFFYRFVNYTPDNIAIDLMSFSGFSEVTPEMHIIQDDPAQPMPQTALRLGDEISFDFDSAPIESGAKSLTMIIRTNATTYDRGGLISLQASGSNRLSPESIHPFEDAQLRSFAPANAPMTVPLPAPIWTSLAGLAATVAYVLRHKRVF